MPRVAPSPRPLAWTLPALYVASGAAALMLEVTWSRLLTLHVGHTTGATSTVLAAFMGGLALGSGVGGRWAERTDRRGALRTYAALELIVAAAALVLPLALSIASPLLELAYADGHAPWRFGIARVGLSLLALIVPTMAMGATYPLATRALADDRRHAEQAAGWLYTANTVGAAGGALLAGFALLPALGMRGTTLVAAALNVLAAAVAWRLSSRSYQLDDAPAVSTATAAGAKASVAANVASRAKRSGARTAASATSAREMSHAAASAPNSPHLVGVGLIAAAMSGLVALLDQVVWTRVLALIVGPTTFAFSAMVGVFIAGLAVGAALGAKLAVRRAAGSHPAVWRPAVWLGVMGLSGAVATVVAMRMADRLLLWIAASAGPTTAFDAVIWRELAVAAALLGPLSITFGAAFPLALAVVGAGSLTPLRVSWTYAANTTGAIAGALLAGFVLIPALGLQRTLQLGALLSILVSLIVLLIATSSWRHRAVALLCGAGVAAAVVTLARWDPALLSSGAYRFAPAVPPEDLDAVLTAGDLLFYQEAAAGTVAVRRLAGTTSLLIDGKPDASNAGDMLTQKLLAHLPLLLHPSPRRACVLGLGSGVTAGAALTHPLTGLDIVEISPAVVEASRFFKTENRNVLEDGRTRVLVADGRSHLRLTNALYDIVISEPSNPWMAGVASLFTREFMASVRDRLAPGGVFCQWTHTYDMSPADLRSIAATFTSVFPHASLWLVGESDALLIGSAEPFAVDAATLAGRFARPGVADDLRGVSVTRAEDLTGLRVADETGLRTYATGAPLQSDDRMALEFSAPRSLAARTGRENVSDLFALASAAAANETTAAQTTSPSVGPKQSNAEQRNAEQWTTRGQMLLRAGAYDLAFAALTQAVAARPTDDATIDALTRAAAGAGALDGATAQLRRLVDADAANVAARAALARLLMARGDAEHAVATIDAARPAPQGRVDPRLTRERASIFADLGDAEQLAPIVAQLERDDPASADTQYFAASLAFIQGDLDTALRRAQALIAAHPTDARAHNLIGAAYATQGQVDAARAAFARSIAADPRAAGTYINAASLELEHGRPDDARRLFASALTIDGTSDAARQGLASSRARE